HVNIHARNGSIPRLRPRHRPRGNGAVNPEGRDPATRPQPGINPGEVGPQGVVQVVERQALAVAHGHDVMHLARPWLPQLRRVPEVQLGGVLAGHDSSSMENCPLSASMTSRPLSAITRTSWVPSSWTTRLRIIGSPPTASLRP